MKKNSEEKIEKAFLNLIQDKEIREISVSMLCKEAQVNRTTFYMNYLDIFDLIDKIKIRMVNEFVDIFKDTRSKGHTKENYLLMFNHIKENQEFYRTYFKLGFDVGSDIQYFDEKLAKERFNNKYIDYHIIFFKAGISAIIKRWLENNCEESPQDIVDIIESEYK